MFIWTISDIAAVIIFLSFVITGISVAVSAHFNAKQYEHKKEPKPKPEPRDTTPKPLPKLPIRAWLIIAVQAAVLIALIWFVAHTLKI